MYTAWEESVNDVIDEYSEGDDEKKQVEEKKTEEKKQD